ncbi:MAG: CDP-alcohol phosphatidyltransferase family protein [Promethearchaeota archaeon]
MDKIGEAHNKQESQRRLLGYFIDGPVKFLIKHNVSPNLLSFFGYSCSLISAIFIGIGGLHFSLWWGWIGPFLFFWAGVFDVFDGEVARRTNQNSKAGAFLDSNLDRLSDATIIFGMIFGNLINYLEGYILIFLVIMISYIRARAENEGLEMSGVGFMERAERVIILFLFLIAEVWAYFLTDLVFGTPSSLFSQIFILIFIALCLYTVIQRFTFSYKSLSKSAN